MLSIGVDRPQAGAREPKPEPVVDLDNDPRFKARPRNELEQRLSGPVWESARGTARHWQDEQKVGDAFWQVLDRAETFPSSDDLAASGSGHDDIVSSSPGMTLERTKRQAKKAKQGKRKEPIRSVHRPVGAEHQTLTEQIATFLATREPFSVRTDPPGEERVGELLRPEHLADFLDLEVVGEEVAAGRPCDLVRATLRPDTSGLTDLRLAMEEGALEYELCVDRERLVILRAVKLLDGEAAEIVEFLDVTFDE